MARVARPLPLGLSNSLLTAQGQGSSDMCVESKVNVSKGALPERSAYEGSRGTSANPDTAELLRELARVKVLFQLRTIARVIEG